ncbi:BTAD domain-containing putative transcriptional regulator [Actinophytocola sp.]|uniref:AfsR/SARP family transcriptional regulator n=1 Tax=Actinophytocola sp. TaxID=1872138 RepID=UPI0025BDE211|nr:BTAD domain-containing putative transcriptional regulator [Actinophytocola sp.]
MLLVNAGHRVSKNRLEDLLWPDTGRPAGSSSLKVTVHGLRRELDARLGSDRDCLRIDYRDSGYLLRIGDEVTVDFLELERLSRQAREADRLGDPRTAAALYQRATACYHGEFLAGAAEDWVAEQREWLCSMTVRTLDYLAEQCLTTGDLMGAAEYSRQTLTMDPANEQAFRRIMWMHVSCGEADRVREWYNLCARRLRERLEAEPGEPTRWLLEQALRSPVARLNEFAAHG